MGWTAHEESVLKQMWIEGREAGVIAKRLHKSKAAIYGKVNYLGLPKRKHGKKRNVSQKPLESVPNDPPRSIEETVVPVSRRLPLEQLTESTCRWPQGDPLSEDFGFCGNESLETGSYCTYHARIAHPPASEQQRPR